jgi:hypothetical protein
MAPREDVLGVDEGELMELAELVILMVAKQVLAEMALLD